MSDAIETLRQLIGTGNDVPLTEKEARAILDHIDRLTRERDEAVARPVLVKIDPKEYEAGLYLNPVTGAVMRVSDDEAAARERAAVVALLNNLYDEGTSIDGLICRDELTDAIAAGAYRKGEG